MLRPYPIYTGIRILTKNFYTFWVLLKFKSLRIQEAFIGLWYYYFNYVCLSRTFGKVFTAASKMNTVQLIKRVLTYLMSHLVHDVRNPICLNGSKPQWMKEFAVLLVFVISSFFFPRALQKLLSFSVTEVNTLCPVLYILSQMGVPLHQWLMSHLWGISVCNYGVIQ